MQTTGNAGGAHNLLLASTGQDFAALLKLMGTGLVVTELLGHGGESGDLETIRVARRVSGWKMANWPTPLKKSPLPVI